MAGNDAEVLYLTPAVNNGPQYNRSLNSGYDCQPGIDWFDLAQYILQEIGLTVENIAIYNIWS